MVIMNKQITLNQILIVILLGFSIFFFCKWYFAGSDTKKETKDLKERIKEIEKEKKEVEKDIKRACDDLKDIAKEIDERLGL